MPARAYYLFRISNVFGGGLEMEFHEKQAKLFKALMHPARLAILDILREGEACVCHIEAALGYRQAYISQHLMVLRDARLVEDRREGCNIYYRVVEPGVFALLDTAQALTGPTGQTPRRRPSRAGACPCLKCRIVSAAAATG